MRPGRFLVGLLTVAAIVTGGAALQALGPGPDPEGPAAPAALARLDPGQRAEFDRRFRQSVVMLHARRYDHAIAALHRLLEIAPEVPEVHVNMGFALLGLGQPRPARDFFAGATALAPMQANAYYGLAVALDATGDRAGALGAMRTFVHLTRPDDPWLPKARSALWEWQSEPSSKAP